VRARQRSPDFDRDGVVATHGDRRALHSLRLPDDRDRRGGLARGDLSPPVPDRGPQAIDASVAAAPIGDALLVVWNSAKGGVRMRVAPPEKIAAAKDVVLFDDWLKEGRAYSSSAVHSVRVVARRDAAIVLLEGSRRVWAFRVDADGKVEPVVAQ
jgi:hypothetical protein